MPKRKIILFLLCFPALAAYAQTDLEKYFNVCLEFGAPLEVVQLFQSFRTYKGENNGSISYIVREDNSLLRDTPYSEYQIWYTIDKDLGLYQSSLIVRGDKPILQTILTGYLKKFNAQYGEPVYTKLDNGSLLIFWYNETTFTVQARLILDIVNSYKFVSITFCSPQLKHTNLLKTLYNGTIEEDKENESVNQPPSAASATTTDDTQSAVPDESPSVDTPPAAIPSAGAGNDENTDTDVPAPSDESETQQENID